MQTFKYSIYINTTPEKLWEALTTTEFTRKFWGNLTIECDWKVGSEIRMIYPRQDTTLVKTGEVKAVDRPNLLSYTGIGGADALVTFEIKQVSPGEVRLNITHDVPTEDLKNAVSEGWFAIMSSLKTLLETGSELDHSWWRG